MVIQILDENGNVVSQCDYYNTVWCEGQLSEEEEDTIEHLEVGETGKLNCGWTVKRVE